MNIACNLRVNTAGTVFCEPEWSWRPMNLADFDLWYIWAGRGELRRGKERFDLSPGAICCLRPGESYHVEHDPAHRLGVCYAHFDFVSARGQVSHPRPSDLPPFFAQLSGSGTYESIMRHVVTLSKQPAGAAQAGLHLAGVLEAMRHAAALPLLAGTAREHQERIAGVVRFVRENPGMMHAVDALADRAGYSIDHFARVFSEVVGQPPREFCISVRLDRARQLLQDSAMSIEQIAAAMGYADVFFFSRQFKQRVGTSPSKWRESVTGKNHGQM